MPSDRNTTGMTRAIGSNSDTREKHDFWTEFSPRGYRRVGLTGLVAAGMLLGYGLAQLLHGETWIMAFLAGVLTLHSARVALRKGAA